MHGQKEEFQRINEGPRLESRRNEQELALCLSSEEKQDTSETGSIEEDTRAVVLRRKELLLSMQPHSSQEK